MRPKTSNTLNLIVILLFSIISFGCESVEPNAKVGSTNFNNMLESVVKIDVWKKSQISGGSNLSRSSGSGVIIDESGYILTNAHVVDMYSSKIIVTLANLERIKANFIGWDHWTDLALIQLDQDDLKTRNLKFKYAEFADFKDIEVGQVVYAAGTPHGLTRTLTKGIISNKDRFFEGSILDMGYETGNFNTWIQTDAALNPGNSGGPLVLPNGKVIGINTRATDNATLNFAVPSNVAIDVLDKLKKYKKVDRSYIGITPAPLQDMEAFFELNVNEGMLVKNVDAGSPAAKAQIYPGDIILEINGKKIDGRFPEQLPSIMNSIAVLPIDSCVELQIFRNSKLLNKTIHTEKLESRVGKEFTLEKWGIGMQEITKVFARQEKINTSSNLMVIGVRQGYPFALAKILSGDIIVSINRKKINSPKELEDIYNDYIKNPQKMLIEIYRNHAISYHIVEKSNM